MEVSQTWLANSNRSKVNETMLKWKQSYSHQVHIACMQIKFKCLSNLISYWCAHYYCLNSSPCCVVRAMISILDLNNSTWKHGQSIGSKWASQYIGGAIIIIYVRINRVQLSVCYRTGRFKVCPKAILSQTLSDLIKNGEMRWANNNNNKSDEWHWPCPLIWLRRTIEYIANMLVSVFDQSGLFLFSPTA